MWNTPAGSSMESPPPPPVPWHCRDDTELKAWHLSPSIPGPLGPWLQMTGALQVLRFRVSDKKDKKVVC